jgi:hypothetical protein
MGTYLQVPLNAENHEQYRMLRQVLMMPTRILSQTLHAAHNTPDGNTYSNVECTFRP